MGGGAPPHPPRSALSQCQVHLQNNRKRGARAGSSFKMKSSLLCLQTPLSILKEIGSDDYGERERKRMREKAQGREREEEGKKREGEANQ